jgi:hypothetical protein
VNSSVLIKFQLYFSYKFSETLNATYKTIQLIFQSFLQNDQIYVKDGPTFPEKDIEDDPEMIEMMKMLEEAKDDLEIAEEKVDYFFNEIV